MFIFSIYPNNSINIVTKDSDEKYELINNITEDIQSEIDSVGEIIIPMEIVNYKKESKYILKNNIYNDYKFILNNDNYVGVKVYDDLDNLIFNKNYSYETINKDDEIIIKFDLLKDYSWRKLKVSLKNVSGSINEYPVLDTVEQNSYNSSYTNNIKNDFLIKTILVGRDKSYMFFWITLLLFTILNVYLCIKKYIFYKYIKFEKINYIIEFISTIILSYTLFKIIVSTHYYNQISYVYLLGLIISLLFTIISIIINLKNKKLEHIYLTLAIPISIFYLVFMLPNLVPDENEHYYKSYNVSLNGIVEKSVSEIPTEMYNDTLDSEFKNETYESINEKLKDKTNYKSVSLIKSRAGNYSNILYIPSGIGLYIARILNLNMYVGYYLARFLNLIVILVLGYLCIKYIPYGKIALLLYLLNPMYIHQSISLSADALANIFCISFISYILYLQKRLFDNKKIDIYRWILVIILSLLVIISKQVYFPLLLLILILFKSKKLEIKKILLLLVVLCLTYSFIINQIDLSMNYELNIVGIIKYFYDFIYLFINTIFTTISYYITTFAGSKLGWLNIDVRILYPIIYIILLCVSPFLIDNNIKKNKNDNNIFILIFIVISLMLFLGFYLIYYDEYIVAGKMLGIQGRYFIPCLILPLLALANNKYKIKINYKLLYILVIIIHSNILFDIITAIL